jgi:hypothetical protein
VDAVHSIQAGTLTLRADGILHAVFDFDEGVSQSAAEEYLTVRDELVGSDPGPVMLEMIRVPFVDRAIRQFLVDGLAPPPCRAVVAYDPALLTLFRSFELVESAEVPTRGFASVDAAVDWIHAQMAAG